jgi:hypothetical protein
MGLADFIYCLESEEMGLVDMQSDEALELINQCLPRNMLIAKIPIQEGKNDTADVSRDRKPERP